MLVPNTNHQRFELHRAFREHGYKLEAGVDPALIAERTKHAQADAAAAKQVIRNAPDMPDPLTEAEVLDALTALRELPTRLDDVDTELRADVYRSLGVTLAYRREDGAEYVKVQAALKGVDLERVGGPSRTMSTPEIRELVPLAEAR